MLDGRLAKLGELPGRQAEQDKRLAAVQEAQQGLRKQQDKLAAELAGLAGRLSGGCCSRGAGARG